MNLASSTILVTGGASGIGLALASRFSAAGSTVIICGRREDKLAEAQRANPRLRTRVCDVAKESECVALVEWAVREHPTLDVLVNNAGIQRRVQLATPEPWETTREELATNLDAPIRLTMLFLPHLASRAHAAVVNVTSGLSFAPLAMVPVYCATKAAMHSFTLSLRHQLVATPVEVIELIPPAVDTDLGGVGLHTFGVNVNEFADAAVAGLQRGELEIAYGNAKTASLASREDLNAIFTRMNQSRA